MDVSPPAEIPLADLRSDSVRPHVLPSRAYRCVHEFFEEQVSRIPDAVALTEGVEHLTYAELNRRANRLANHLRARGVVDGDFVGLRVRRSMECVVAMLAVMKAGAAYVPLEEGLPEERQHQMAQDCEPKLVITVPPLIWDGSITPELSLVRERDGIGGQQDTDLRRPLDADAVMYVPYTSGSTGRPKGTVVPHRTLPGLVAASDCVDWTRPQVTLYHTAQSWDAHVFDLYPPLMTGGRVVIAPAGLTDPVAVARLARDNGVTVLFLPTAAFNVIVDIDATLLAGPQTLIVGGEALSPRHVATALAALPEARLLNGYGPSECTVFSCVHPIEPGDAERRSIPIGRPVGDRRVYVLDTQGRLARDGEQGELCIGGPAVSHGYLRRPGLTAEKFVPDPFGCGPGARLYRTGDVVRWLPEGDLEFIGRIDHQIKVRGFRVELGEVEAALREQAGVRDAVVTVDKGATAGGARLIGYVVQDGAMPATSAGLRDVLADRLPSYMVPSAIVTLKRLPLTHNGKVDRSALLQLSAPTDSSADFEPPSTQVERCLADILQRLFGRDRIGLRDHFFELGGNSLMATQVVSRIRQRLGVEVPQRALFDAPVLADLAVVVERAHARPRESPIERIPRRNTGNDGRSACGPLTDTPQGTAQRLRST